MSEVPEDEALIHLQLQPEGDLFPCCDGTEEISQSSSNDTPAPERTVCQPCSTGSQMPPATRGDVTSEEEDDNKEVVSSEAAEGLSEEEPEDESQEVLEDEDQEVADVSHVAGKLMAEAAPVDESEALADPKVSVEDKILAAEEPDVAQTKESVEVEKVVEELTIAEVVQEPGEEASTDSPAEEEQPVAKESVSEEPAHKSSVKGTPV